ncbi:GNAT family N-acetyltransferase [Pseudomonas phytophila]|uniref:GNAT family N-acetyltransferase n=1 Tax=Pseudomonas phytophila TaxID=2867264 RepID=A0ABY6FL58_9PSED|nr:MULTISPECIES: GNAT family N-acetyltransferase [Pseudomonas]MCD5986652.1 GNAT family N-acetyltransferase [Pseudomonas quasicaspiana]UXZ98630.1 GNAT family N-acetyltransferase [Pseudomonas phytophila]
MNVSIELTSNPTDEQVSAILTPLRAYNVAQAGESGAEKFALLVRDEQSNEVLGGLNGSIFYRWMFIELLAVPEQARGQGLGSRLMTMAEDLAREKNCVGIWLDTFDFQAPDFYRGLGYSECGQINDYPPGHTRYFFQKRLDNVDLPA